jgi:hypothetical protein
VREPLLEIQQHLFFDRQYERLDCAGFHISHVISPYPTASGAQSNGPAAPNIRTDPYHIPMQAAAHIDAHDSKD